MLEVIGLVSVLGGPVLGAAVLTEAVLARIERRDGTVVAGRGDARPGPPARR